MTKGAQRIPLGITPLTSTPVHVFIRNLKTEGEGKSLEIRSDALSTRAFITYLVVMSKHLAK